MDYETIRRRFTALLDKLGDGAMSVEDFKITYDRTEGSDSDKKMALDQSLRDKLFDLTLEDADPDKFVTLLNFTSSIIQMDICTAGTLFVMLSDMFDTLTLDRCDILFDYVERRVSIWKQDVFYNAGKNYMLRMCNDLLRRLSKSQNTVFCGRIQLFLARLFPLEEKSGLNLTSQFNVENMTLYATKEDEADKQLHNESESNNAEMEVEEGETKDSSPSVPVDYNLYRKFWALQDYFRKPTQCYDKAAWKTFISYADEVLSCFSSYKLDDYNTTKSRADGASNQQPIDDPSSLTMTPTKLSSRYFAKYLTSEKVQSIRI